MNAHSVVKHCTLSARVGSGGDRLDFPRMKNAEIARIAEAEALLDRGLLASPRPTVDRDKLEHHLREALKLLHVDLDSENLRETPRRWAESLVTMTSGYDYTDPRKLITLFRKA